jgi:hypothetical protein
MSIDMVLLASRIFSFSWASSILISFTSLRKTWKKESVNDLMNSITEKNSYYFVFTVGNGKKGLHLRHYYVKIC